MDHPPPGPGLLGVLLGAALMVVAALAFTLPVYTRVRSNHPRDLCRHHQRQLVLALITYRDGQGMQRSYPPADGSDFLIHLYTSEEISEPGLFICPASGDHNDDGAALALGSGDGRTGNTCSYAGRRNRQARLTIDGGTADASASEAPVIADDDGPGNGAASFNHEDEVVVAFLDGHVEVLELTDRRLRGATTIGEGLLDPLAN